MLANTCKHHFFAVLGCEQCGAVQAALDVKFRGGKEKDRIQLLLANIRPGLEGIDEHSTPENSRAGSTMFRVGGPWIMNSPDKKKRGLKEKIFHEMAEYWLNVIYLGLVFAAFTQYRRFVLAAHGITYTNYWVAVIEALILAKVVMIGDVIRLGRRLEHKPLIYSTLLKTVVFSLFVGVFTIIEHMIKSLWKGEGLTGGLIELLGKGNHELLAGCLVVLVTFIPFFAFRELGRVLGEGNIWALFFRKGEHKSQETHHEN